MRRRRACLLGGSGFVGSVMAERLIERGWQVRIPLRRRERHRDLLVLPGVELVQADVHDEKQLHEVIGNSDLVINLVGILNERGHSGRGFRHVHVELPRKIIAACHTQRVTRVLHMSALGADATAGASHYLRSKGEGEELMHAAADPKLGVTSFRPSVIFGPGDSFFNRFAGLLNYAPGIFPLACPDARFAPVYVGDVAAAFINAIDQRSASGQRYELCGPRSYSLRELVALTARLLCLRRRIVGLSRGLSKLQAAVLEWVPGKPFSLDNFRSLQQDSVCSNNGLERLHINPTPVEDIVPLYLSPLRQRQRYAAFRRRARRE